MSLPRLHCLQWELRKLLKLVGVDLDRVAPSAEVLLEVEEASDQVEALARAVSDHEDLGHGVSRPEVLDREGLDHEAAGEVAEAWARVAVGEAVDRMAAGEAMVTMEVMVAMEVTVTGEVTAITITPIRLFNILTPHLITQASQFNTQVSLVMPAKQTIMLAMRTTIQRRQRV